MKTLKKALTAVSKFTAYRIVFAVVAFVWNHGPAQLIFDLPINLFWLAVSILPWRRAKVAANMKILGEAIAGSESKKEVALGRYAYEYDGKRGFPDWVPRCPRVVAAKNFKDDCDGFAVLAEWLYPGGERYMILPYDLCQVKRFHVVYVFAGKVYSSGRIYDMGPVDDQDALGTYVREHYGDECGVLVMSAL